MPTENTASSSVATDGAAAEGVLGEASGNCVRNTAPKNHSHEMPISDRNTARLRRATCDRASSVTRTGFQSIESVGSAGRPPGSPGSPPRRPAPARRRRRRRTGGRAVPLSISTPAATVPSRIATNVPISTRPLPPTSSSGPQALGQVGVLHRTEQRRVQPHQEDAQQEQREAPGVEAPRARPA